MFEDGLQTQTSQQQYELEQTVRALYEDLAQSSAQVQETSLRLRRADHIKYLHGGLQRLPAGYVSLDASRPWICYWIVHSLALLQAPLPPALTVADIAGFLRSCQARSGGYGGGPRQLPHLAPSYAAVAALLTLGGPTALSSVDRVGMMTFLQAMAVPPDKGGGFQVCQASADVTRCNMNCPVICGGETDVRGCYTAMAIAHMLQLDVKELALRSGLADYIGRCQTYEGGIGGEPGNEAHGGYTYCGLAAACLADCVHVLDLPALSSWATSLQGRVEGGFMGRTNKLVDGCYSFWQGSLFALLRRHSAATSSQAGIPRAPQAEPAEAPSSPDQLLAKAQQAADDAQEAADQAVQLALGQMHLPDPEQDGPTPPASTTLAAAAQKQQLAQRAAAFLQAAKAGAAVLCPSPASLSRSASGRSEAAGSEAHTPSPQPDPAAPTAGQQGAPAPLQRLCHSIRPSQHRHESQEALPQVNTTSSSGLPPDYNPLALQLWVLQACQGPKGGLRDKPGKPPDYYHTCYCLSGLASAQHESGWVLGPLDNLLEPADPLCNVLDVRLAAALTFFRQQATLSD